MDWDMDWERVREATISRRGLNMSGSRWEQLKMSASGLKKRESGWE